MLWLLENAKSSEIFRELSPADAFQTRILFVENVTLSSLMSSFLLPKLEHFTRKSLSECPIVNICARSILLKSCRVVQMLMAYEGIKFGMMWTPRHAATRSEICLHHFKLVVIIIVQYLWVLFADLVLCLTQSHSHIGASLVE